MDTPTLVQSDIRCLIMTCIIANQALHQQKKVGLSMRLRGALGCNIDKGEGGIGNTNFHENQSTHCA